MNILAICFAILAGIFTTVETSLNAQLGKYITPGIATLHSLITGVLFMLLISLVKGNLNNYSRVVTVNPILLIGGIFGALIIYLSSMAIPELGISNSLILILAGQLLSGLVADVLANDIEISFKKMAGLALFLIGTIMFVQE
ncbi:MAG TPA: DMT family transporter [Mobilitalea sp.]|nr:DMT family transporter [Mobilitalea sp.]